MLPVLNIPLVPFPDWVTMWADDKKKAATNRYYLTPQGSMFKVHKDGYVYVPSRNRFNNRQAVTWTQHEQDYENNPNDWVEIATACGDVITETVAFLDLVYERLCSAFDPLLVDANYQHLWGWRPGINPLDAPRPTPGMGTGLQQSGLPQGKWSRS